MATKKEPQKTEGAVSPSGIEQKPKEKGEGRSTSFTSDPRQKKPASNGWCLG